MGLSRDEWPDGLAKGSMLTAAKSVTHQHILAVINTESPPRFDGSPLRVLDVGCGDGRLLAYIQDSLPKLNESLPLEVYGFDVNDSGTEPVGFPATTIEALRSQFPHITWHTRIACGSVDERWPYPDNYFDVIVSNQVGEHIGNLFLFFDEISRTLRPGGYSVHLFPLKHYVVESHISMPLVHRISSHDARVAFIIGLCVSNGKIHRVHGKSEA